jgi:diguanylate cyclase (GGDEF)-like protein
MERFKNLVTVTLLFFFITLIIYFTGGSHIYWPLFFVPLFLGALTFNEAGGAGVGILASLALFLFLSFSPPKDIDLSSLSIQFSVASGIMISTGFFFGWFFRTQKKRLADLSEGTMMDRLTGLRNYGYFAERLEEERKRADRFGSRLAMMMIDIDHFKPYNDRFGHAAGNLLLKNLAAIIEEHVRDIDIVCRYGGEEFSVILPNTEEEAMAVAERIRAAVESAVFEGEPSEPVVKKTVSIGVAVYPNCCENELELIDCADRALNRAKESGRNKVVQYDPSVDSTAG